MVALDGDRIAGIIHFGNTVSGKICNALSAGAPGQIWIGTDCALNRVNYKYASGSLSWKSTSFSASDGVPGPVADIAWQHDSVYIAAGNGVFALPVAAQPAVRDIRVYITGIRINDRDTVLRSTWSLPYGMNDLDIHYAGIDMDGFAPTYQYAINSDAWQDVGDDHLVLKRLPPGTYRISIRALKHDGTPSAAVASLQVSLHAPFWRSVWFWLVIAIIFIGAFAFALQHFFRKKREKQLRHIAAEHELVISQQQTFSALMNPHFIFNALNSIQHYVLKQDKQSANRYLSGFGRLIRMNFESAQTSFISLEEELERLQLYLSLEKMRFGEKLSYTIDVAEDIAPEDWQIPAMMIQPYLENALLHGIAPARNEGHLCINISKHQEGLQISICDNGIGMANSALLPQQTRHVSRSMELIRKRIAVLRKLRKQSVHISVTPCYPDDAAYPGTQVTMIFGEHFAE